MLDRQCSKVKLKVTLKVLLVALLFPFFLQASYILKDDILKLEVVTKVEQIGSELFEKTAISEYLIATNEHFEVGANFVTYLEKYHKSLHKPYVVFIFAPQAKITKNIKKKGRFGLIASSLEIKKLYDYDDVRDAVLDVVAIKDKNTVQDKDNIGVLQAYSELAENIASSKNIELKTAIPNDTRYFIKLLKVLVYIGSILVLWMFILRPLFMRIKNVRK